MTRRPRKPADKILAGLNEALEWSKGFSEVTAVVHLPDGRKRRMTSAEWRAHVAANRTQAAAHPH